MRLREREARDDFVHLHLPHTSLQQQSHTHSQTCTHSQNCINKRSFFFLQEFIFVYEGTLCAAPLPLLAHLPLCPLPIAYGSCPLHSLLRPHSQPFCSRLAFCLVLRSVAVVISVAAAAVHAFVAVSLRESPSVPV